MTATTTTENKSLEHGSGGHETAQESNGAIHGDREIAQEVIETDMGGRATAQEIIRVTR